MGQNASSPSLTIHNNCGFTVHLLTVSGNPSQSATIQPHSSWNQAYQTFPTDHNTGVAVKLSNPAVGDGAVQVEYTQAYGKLIYELAIYAGNPFEAYSQVLKPSDGSHVINCPGGPCADELQNGNEKIFSANENADLDFYICSGP